VFKFVISLLRIGFNRPNRLFEVARRVPNRFSLLVITQTSIIIVKVQTQQDKARAKIKHHHILNTLNSLVFNNIVIIIVNTYH
jgi:hypothetical protein